MHNHIRSCFDYAHLWYPNTRRMINKLAGLLKVCKTSVFYPMEMIVLTVNMNNSANGFN